MTTESDRPPSEQEEHPARTKIATGTEPTGPPPPKTPPVGAGAGQTTQQGAKAQAGDDGGGADQGGTKAQGKEENAEDRSLEDRRSRVRVNITYWMAGSYILAALFLIIWLAKEGRVELALGVFASLGSASGAVIGYWYGSRGDALAKKMADTLPKPKPGG